MSEMREQQWAAAVGRFMLAFGHIEWTTYVCLVHLPIDRIFPVAKDLSFKARVDLIIHVLDDVRFSEPARKAVQAALRKAIELNAKRNIIAHNPVMLHLYQDDGGALETRFQMSPFNKPEKAVQLAELEGWALRAEYLAGELYEKTNALEWG
jgi:hypothetical protein